MKRRRWRRRLRWIGTTLCALILITWGVSAGAMVARNQWFGDTYIKTGTAHGFVVCQWHRSTKDSLSTHPNTGWDMHRCPNELDFGFEMPYIEILGLDRGWLALPCWLLLLIFGIPTGLLWTFRERDLPPNACEHCGYDLTGNVSGRCPECGTPLQEPPATLE